MFLRLTVAQIRSAQAVPVLIPTDEIRFILPADPAKPDGPAKITLQKEVLLGDGWSSIVTVNESVGQIEAAMAEIDYPVIHPGARRAAPQRDLDI